MRSRSRSRSRRSQRILVGAGAGAGAGAVESVCSEPEPEPEPSKTGSGSEKGYNCGEKLRNINSEITRNSWTNSLPMFVINNFRTSAMNYLNFLDCQKHAFAMIWKSSKFFIRYGHATDLGRHLGIIRLRILNALGIGSVLNDHLGAKQWYTNRQRKRFWDFLQCQPVTLDDNGWQISTTLIQTNFQTQVQVSKRSSFYIWHFWKKTNCWFRLIWGLQHRSRSRSRSRRNVLLGAGAGAEADQKCHGSASLMITLYIHMLLSIYNNFATIHRTTKCMVARYPTSWIFGTSQKFLPVFSYCCL